MRGVEGLDKRTARKVDFYTRQFVDAIAPSNFIATNPEVLKATLESGGRNLLNGLANLLRDIDASRRTLSITMSDLDAFRVGETIAATLGKVIFQNEMMQLIQYSPLTDEVRRVPLLIVPPWINKFYVLDLRPRNSFIRWAVAQRHTVFVISWVNPDARLAEKSFEDYMLQGPIAALDVVKTATGERETNLVGYCLGGTLLAATLAYLAGKGDTRAVTATYFATLVDFTDVGDMAVFIDEEQLEELEARMRDRGYLEAHEMAMSFNMLRANDLIWSFVVNNYLLGKEPLPFDVLYWNADATRMPAAMHSFYLRNMYHENSGSPCRAASPSRGSRSICERSRYQASFFQRARITSRRGGRRTAERSWTLPKTSWRAPRDDDSVDLIANGGVGCGVRPGSSRSRRSEGAFGQGRHARAAEWFGGF